VLQPKTKIIATLGPASATEEIIEKLILAGMDIARLNFSHATFDTHLDIAMKVRTVAERLGETIAIFADLPGPKIRSTWPALPRDAAVPSVFQVTPPLKRPLVT